jgi:hypothetical protein
VEIVDRSRRLASDDAGKHVTLLGRKHSRGGVGEQRRMNGPGTFGLVEETEQRRNQDIGVTGLSLERKQKWPANLRQTLVHTHAQNSSQ